MAKLEVQDFRIDFIEAVGRTDNLRILRTIANQMENRSYSANLTKGELLGIAKGGIEKVRELLGDSAGYFKPLQEIERMSVSSYFEKMTKGYNELIEKNKCDSKLDNQRIDYQEKISKYRAKGKNDKVKEFEYKLYCVDFPNENLARIEDAKMNLLAGFQAGTVSKEQYDLVMKDLQKGEKLSNSTLRTVKNTRVTENIVFYNKMQEEVRNFLCYSFFDKNGKSTESYNRFLMTYEGGIKSDLEHMILLYHYLKSVNYKRISEVEGVLYYTAIEYLYRDLNDFITSPVKIFLKQSPTEFYSERLNGYTYGYIPYYLLPKGYKGYMFEPKNLSQQAFISAMESSDLSVDNMVAKYKNAQSIMKDRENGIFYSFLDKDTENRLMKVLITEDFPLEEMDGVYKDSLLSEFRERRNIFGDNDTFGVMTNMYSRVVKPYALEVLGSYVRNFCFNLPKLKDKDSIFIYYVSAERIAIAVREDIEDEMLKEVFPEAFLNVLEKMENPKIEDIAFGKLL